MLKRYSVNGFIYTFRSNSVDTSRQFIDEVSLKIKQTKSLQILKAVLAAAGSSLDKVVKATVFITDMDDFAAMNEVYAKHFGAHTPARSCVEVSRLPKDVKVEIEVIA